MRDLRQELAKRIADAEVSPYAIAKAVGCDRSTLYRLLAGQCWVRMELYEKIVQYLDRAERAKR